ncbi:MAG: hypothetical protein ACLPVF_19195 [Acidimicrobiales bacterium]
MLSYLPIFTLLLPAPHLGYQDHIGGLIGGLLCGWIFTWSTDPEPYFAAWFIFGRAERSLGEVVAAS